MELFQKAIILKVRFNISCIEKMSGTCDTEDLYDLELPQLDTLAKTLNKAVKEQTEESFIGKKTKSNKLVELQLEIVKKVIEHKLAKEEREKNAAARRKQNQLVMGIVQDKENKALYDKSIDELKEIIKGNAGNEEDELAEYM